MCYGVSLTIGAATLCALTHGREWQINWSFMTGKKTRDHHFHLRGNPKISFTLRALFWAQIAGNVLFMAFFAFLPSLDDSELSNQLLLVVVCSCMGALLFLQLLDEIVETCMVSRIKRRQQRLLKERFPRP